MGAKDYITLFDHYSAQFNRALEEDCGGDWNRLEQEEREIAALWKLLADGYNGGFLQFFCNWGYSGFWYAMCGLQKIGDRELLERFHRTYKTVFEKFKDDTRLRAYWDIPEYLTEEDRALLEQTDEFFWDRGGEELARRAYTYYHNEAKTPPENGGAEPRN